MTTTQADHEHPQYAQKADLEALEGRIINRLAELETRLVRDINTSFWRQLLGVGGILLTVLAILGTALFFTITNLWAQIGALQAAVQRLTPPG